MKSEKKSYLEFFVAVSQMLQGRRGRQTVRDEDRDVISPQFLRAHLRQQDEGFCSSQARGEETARQRSSNQPGETHSTKLHNIVFQRCQTSKRLEFDGSFC